MSDGYDSEFARLGRKARRAVFPPKDVELPSPQGTRRKSNNALEALQRASEIVRKSDLAKQKKK